MLSASSIRTYKLTQEISEIGREQLHIWQPSASPMRGSLLQARIQDSKSATFLPIQTPNLKTLLPLVNFSSGQPNDGKSPPACAPFDKKYPISCRNNCRLAGQAAQINPCRPTSCNWEPFKSATKLLSRMSYLSSTHRTIFPKARWFMPLGRKGFDAAV